MSVKQSTALLESSALQLFYAACLVRDLDHSSCVHRGQPVDWLSLSSPLSPPLYESYMSDKGQLVSSCITVSSKHINTFRFPRYFLPLMKINVSWFNSRSLCCLTSLFLGSNEAVKQAAPLLLLE